MRTTFAVGSCPPAPSVRGPGWRRSSPGGRSARSPRLPERSDVRFTSAGDELSGWHLRGEGHAFAGEGGRPCVVMAAGMGGTKDSSLLPFAEAFAEAGLDALLFDYRGFGESEGETRQLAWPSRHRADLKVAVDFARGLDGVDPERIVLWGWSWGGAHVVDLAAREPAGIAALVALAPDVDGMATVIYRLKVAGPGSVARLIGHGLRDLAGDLRGQQAQLVPLVGPARSHAALNTPDSEGGYKAMAGPTWRNEVAPRLAIVESLNRPLRRAGQLRCPILIQVGQRDDVVPPDVARKLAWEAKGRSELREYPCGHYDLLLEPLRERLIEHQLAFLHRRMAGERQPAASA